VAIKTLVENKNLAEVLAKEGQKTAIKRFSIERWIKETEKVYRETAK
jgi:glycosyltransferase involved in cell wall biosynthesis